MEHRKTTVARTVTDGLFWKGKRVLVTGHSGFKGGWLCTWLKLSGANVVGFSLQPPTVPSMFETALVADGMTSIIGDVRDLNYLQEIVNNHETEIIFHLAAQPLVRFSYKHPVEAYATNIMGTVNILEATRLCNSVKTLVVITSDKCYENYEWVWGYRENDRMGGSDPYSSSKGCAELISSAYHKSYFSKKDPLCQSKSIASVRAGNVIGGGDWGEDRLVPDCIKAISEGRQVRLRNPNAIRPWQFVLEPLYGYLVLAERLFSHGEEYAGGWNFGPSDEDTRPVSWIVEMISCRWNIAGQWEFNPDSDYHEAMHLKLDCSKAKKYLGWSPKLTLAEALEWTVEWYQAYENRKDMRQMTVDQIFRYESIV
jgi:CDP-glucose 4,6-dehydratase